MFTSMLVLVLTASAQGADPLTWNQDYSQAQKKGAAVKKPLAVFLGTGAQGWNQVVREGELNQEIQDLLQSSYLPVYIDTTTPEGKRWADAFQIPSGKGVVLSDRVGVNQAFWHEGSLTSQNLARQLQQAGSSNRVSFYDATGAATSTATLLQGVATGGTLQADSSYCPTCNGGGSRRR